MQYLEDTGLTVISTDVVDETYSAHNSILPYKLGDKVILSGRVYEARVSMGALVNYHYDMESNTATDMWNGVIVDETSVSIVSGNTTVYVKDLDKYYIAKSTGTIDFTAENPQLPANFDEITTGGFRFTESKPALKGTLYWKDLGAINSLSIFDEYLNTQSERASNMTYVFSAGVGNKLALFNVVASSVTVTIDTGGTPVVLSKSLVDVSISNWGDYFYNPVFTKSEAVFDIPISQSSQITVFFDGSSIVKCGAIKYGRIIELGCTLDNVQFGLDDYTKKVISEDGNIYIEEGKYNKRANLDIIIAKESLDGVMNKLVGLRAKQVVFIADESDTFSSLLIYGYYQNYSAVISKSDYTKYSMEIKGII